MKKSTLIMILSLIMAVAVGMGSTVAYLQDTDEDVNVMTLGKVYITQNEQERVDATKLPTEDNLKEFSQEKPLYPAVFEGSSIPWDAASVADQAWKVIEYNENAVDKFVTVSNTGTADAYVRTLIAFEGDETYGPEGAYIHTVSNGSNVADEIRMEYVGVATIDEVKYTVYEYTYLKALAPETTTIPSLKQVYMNHAATNDVIEQYGDQYDILVLSQAVQTKGFADPDTALNAAFGDTNVAKVEEWFANIGENIGTPGDKWPNNNPPVAFTGKPADLYKLLSEASDAGSGNVTIDLTESYDMTGYDWKSIKVDGYHGADIVTVNGNGNYIKGLNVPLYSSGFAGGCGIVIKDLTIMDSKMQAPTSQGSGTFICCVDSMDKITLENCHAINVELNGKSRTGGLIGWTSGYSNQNDGPVKTYVTIDGCTVENCTINAETESAGGFIGHSGASDWTYTTVTNSAVIDTVINGGSDRTGIYLGTSNVGETTFTNCTYENVTGTLNEAHVLYGRTAHGTTGKLTIDGVAIN